MYRLIHNCDQEVDFGVGGVEGNPDLTASPRQVRDICTHFA